MRTFLFFHAAALWGNLLGQAFVVYLVEKPFSLADAIVLPLVTALTAVVVLRWAARRIKL